jgi:Uma2 family endonuclease
VTDLATGIPALGREEIDYPPRDGRPMAETDTHRDELMAAIDSLKARYADRDDVYVAGDLLIYYEEGNPRARFAPDVFVVFGVPKRRRRVYKLWEEGVAPAFVLELSSKGTWVEDAGNKKALCARFGVSEYFLFDPEADYLDPPLQGFRLLAGELRRIEPDDQGVFVSETLGLSLHLEDLRLVLIDLQTGERLLRYEELQRARGEAEAVRGEAEAARGEAEARARAAEDEVARLRAELAKRST